MSKIRKYGKPDLFNPFYCIKSTMGGDYVRTAINNASNRPNLIVRVFRFKLRELLSDVTKKHIWGKLLAVYAIVFQKLSYRILIILTNEDKTRDQSGYDNIVSAENPDPVLKPILHSIVKRCMINGPCGLSNESSSCMRDSNCSNKFLKEFSCVTSTFYDYNTCYRRRVDGRVCK